MSSRAEPFVSVVTPVYNGSPYFDECIRSVLDQTYDNWEYVVVDNCSTDGTLDLAHEYARQDRRVRHPCYLPSIPVAKHVNAPVFPVGQASTNGIHERRCAQPQLDVDSAPPATERPAKLDGGDQAIGWIEQNPLAVPRQLPLKVDVAFA